MRQIAALVGLWFGCSGLIFANGIVGDGGTATNVSTAANGRQTVGIAPAVSGVSHNTYSQFNVSQAGADLNNVGINARNIVNQVTSTNPSLIQGDITVLGPRANVILANPNGITVNGGKFVNTGNVALSTGEVSFHDFNPAPGLSQRNIVLNTDRGRIIIGPDGLSGAMLNLELIAKSVVVNGPVQNLFSGSSAGIRAVVGDSHAEIDASVSPTDNLNPWVTYSSPNTANVATAIDITPLGSLTAGRIELLVTDQGAGVRHAGAIFANVGDFVVSASGDIKISGGHIQAANDLVVATSGITSERSDNLNSQLSASRNVSLLATSVQLADTAISAGRQQVHSDGSATVMQRGDIQIGISGSITPVATTLTNSTLIATGGIGLFNLGHAVNFDASTLTAQQNLLVDAQSVAMAARWNGAVAAQSALVSETGVVKILAPGAVQITGSLVKGAAGITVNAASLTLAASHGDDVGAVQKGSMESVGGAIALNATGLISITGADLLAATDITTQSAGFIIQNDGGNRSTMTAVNGGIVIDSSGDILNSGSLIQGNQRIVGNQASQGAISLHAAGTVLNQSPDVNTQAAVFGVNDDVVIQAAGNITNHYGRILSNGALLIAAQGDVGNIVDQQLGVNGGRSTATQTDDTRWLFLSKRTSSFSVDYGQVDRVDQLSYLVSAKGTTITGRNVSNLGGVILANNAGDINIDATGTFHNESLFAGRADYQSSCLITCRSSASSTVQNYGGNLAAGNNIRIHAGIEASNKGGTVLAAQNLTITAPKVIAQGVAGYRAYQQTRGFKSWFGDTWARLYATDVGGSWIANGGTLAINGQGIINGGSFSGATQVAASDGVVTLRPAQRDPVTIERHLGLTSWLWQ